MLMLKNIARGFSASLQSYFFAYTSILIVIMNFWESLTYKNQ
jgi:hypothetical protein